MNAEPKAIELAVDKQALQTLDHNPTPLELIQRAVQSNAQVDVMEKLLGLQERWERNESRKAFDAAISKAKSEIPIIRKGNLVDFTTARGRTSYSYEDMATIAATIDPILSRYGLSYRFRTNSDSKSVTITCVLSHSAGHCEENSLYAPHDASGNKNAIQAVGSAVTYLQRYTLKAALGLAAAADDDARAVNPPPMAPGPAPAPKPQPKPEAPKYATAATRTWMIEQLTDYRELAGEYFRAISQLLPNEEIEDLPLEYVPINHAQLDALKAKLTAFSDGDPAERAFAPNPQPLAGKTPMAGGPGGPVDASSEPWYNAIVPVPRKGQKRDDYLKAPDTIGSLWEARHGTDDLAQEARQRLWGFVTNYEPKGWTKRDGTQMPASDSDRAFRASLDSFAEWFKQTHPNEKL